MIRENLEIYEYQYPFFDRVNFKIQTYIKSLEYNSAPNRTLGQSKIRWMKNSQLNIVSREVGIIVNWITQVVNRDCSKIILGDGRHIKLKCSEIWGIDYDEGSQLGTHSHGGYAYTFSYGVSVPKRSSTIIFPTSRRRVKQKEGQLLVFDSRLRHRVPYNKDEGRCILVGNFIYDWANIDN